MLYNWSSNAILATPVKYLTDTSTIATFKEKITYLTKRGFKLVFNIIYNVASKAVKKYLEEENIRLKLVEPHNPRVNAAERVVQTFKNHTIEGLSTCDEKVPSVLRSKLIKQAQETLNMLQTPPTHPHSQRL